MHLFDHDFVFSSQFRTRLSRHGLFWGVVWLYFVSLYSIIPIRVFLQNNLPKHDAILKGVLTAGFDAFAFMPAHMLLSYGIMYLLVPQLLYRNRYVLFFWSLIGLMILSASLSSAIAKWVVWPVRNYCGLPGGYVSYVHALMAGLRGSTTVAGFAVAIRLVKAWYLKQQAYQQIEREKLQAELQLLKSQVHPHFLFNTLNNLYALTLRKSEHSPAVVLKLSELLSYMLYDCNAAEVPLVKEMAFMKNYIGLEQLRYGSRLDISMSFNGDLESRQIAPLLLVPFLENAFKHGTSEQLEQAWIFMDLSVCENTLSFKLINSRDDDSSTDRPMGGIGLQNVKKRLELLYPGRFELLIQSEEDTFLVALTIRLPTDGLPPADRPSVEDPMEMTKAPLAEVKS